MENLLRASEPGTQMHIFKGRMLAVCHFTNKISCNIVTHRYNVDLKCHLILGLRIKKGYCVKIKL